MAANMFAQETEPSLQINNLGDEISFYIGNKKYTFLFKETVQNLTNSQFDFGNRTFVVVSYVKDGAFAGFYEKTGYQKLQDKDGKVNLSSDAAKLLQQFKAYEIKETEDLSTRTVELKDALIENNNYGKVKAIIVLSQALSEDEYQSAFAASATTGDCRIELGTKKAYTNECLDKYIDALAGKLNREAEYFDRNCNCIIPTPAGDLLGNSDPDFQKWFESIGGAEAIKQLEDRIYEANIVRYTDNIARGIYGADEYGAVNIPQSIKDKVRREARESAFPTIKAVWAIERSGADPNGISFNINPFSIERVGYYYYRALAVTSQDEGYELVTDVGIQVGITWLLEIIPAIKTAKGNLAKWTETKVKPVDLISEIESKGYYIIDGNEEAIILRNASNQEGKVSITARNLDNVQWVDDAVGGTDLTSRLLRSGEDFTVLTNARKLPGTATGTGTEITGKWLRGTEGNAGLFPKSVADKLRGRTFNNFDEFRQAFWKEVANDPNLAKQFTQDNIYRMKAGAAPRVELSQQLGGQQSYILHHKTPINQGGGVYDVDNLYIVTPKYHKEILAPAYHYGYGY